MGVDRMSRFQVMKLENLCKVKYGKDHKRLGDGQIPVYGTGGIMRYANSALYDRKSVLIPRKGSLGNIYFVDEPFWTVDTLFYTEIDESKVLPEYLYYKLKTIDFVSMNVGSAVPSLTTSILNAVELEIPDFNTQKRIVEIMLVIDSKIENNRKINDNLAKQAMILYQQFLIDNHEQLSTKKINDISTIVSGGTPSKKIDEYYTDGEISWITPKDLSNQKTTFISSGEINITSLGLQKSSAKLMPESTVLFSSRAPIGYIAISKNPVATNQGFKSLVADKGVSHCFLFLLLKANLEKIENLASGSTFKEVSGAVMKSFEIELPSIVLISNFSETIEPIFQLIERNEDQVKTLTKIRDNLLPNLLTGEIEL